MQPHRGRPKKRELVVTEAQKSELQQLARQSRSRRSVSFRARIILSCTNDLSNAAVARKLRTTGFTVGARRGGAGSVASFLVAFFLAPIYAK